MSKIRILFAGFFFALLGLSVTWGWRGIPEYDKVDIDYGFPLIWGRQTISEIILMEPSSPSLDPKTYRMKTIEEIWQVKTANLLFDILFWNGLIAITAITPTKLPKLRIQRSKRKEGGEKFGQSHEKGWKNRGFHH